MAELTQLSRSKGPDKVPFWDMTVQHFERIAKELDNMQDAMSIMTLDPKNLNIVVELLATVLSELVPLMRKRHMKDEATGKDLEDVFKENLAVVKKAVTEYYVRSRQNRNCLVDENTYELIRNFRNDLMEAVDRLNIGIKSATQRHDFGESEQDKLEPL